MTREQRDKILFDGIAKNYARKDSCISSALARKSKLLSVMKPVLAELPNFGTIVDIGCGVGGPAKSIYYQGFFSTPFAELVMVPQTLIIPFSRLASSMDRWLEVNMPALMKKISFNIVVIGRFPKKKNLK